ncbi:MAG: protein-L-isoaspartate(D-aspartate) O-methyltransferase [Gammaproteobacteria bacterium]|jgi:protein-L-isoaspartate(D-aspartate) O-methyltransferase|nr:protein-L-isoaspartate(D-aspartate) O-methyltransferase [Gammaproteobacteria bacterium]MBT7603371.1 protein-L-isoaspartate(D-aspartate) O-methyltransferase [Gammaproteobacteria bacterium]
MSLDFKNFSGTGMTSDSSRMKLISRLEKEGILNKKVLDAMKSLPRHVFIDEAISSKAYDDTALPIGKSQTISQPYIVAKMTEIIMLNNPKRVLEIGTGSGYQAAILSLIVDKVYTVERIESLHNKSKEVFKKIGIRNIYSKFSDGNNGWSEKSPFDAIIVTAGASSIPKALKDQLSNDNGILISPIKKGGKQYLQSTLKDNGKYKEKIHGIVNFVPLLDGVIT